VSGDGFDPYRRTGGVPDYASMAALRRGPGIAKLASGFWYLARYHDALFQHPVESPKFAEGCRARHEAKAAKGVFKLTLLLFGCPACRRQLLEKKITVCQGSEWKAVDELGARLQVPMGVDLRRAIG
jgi:hypothetical protein